MNQSYWIKSVPKTNYPTLNQSIDVDIAIIGAGICGLSTAYYLSHTTQHVAIFEADHIGYGASGRNTGKLTSQHGLIYQYLCEHRGYDFAKKYYHAHEEAIDSIEEIIQDTQIDCDFHRTDSVLYTFDEQKISVIQDEYQACLNLEIPCAYMEESSYPIPFQAGIKMFHQAQFHPQKYLVGLAKYIHSAGIQIYENTTISDVKRVADGYTLIAKEYRIHAKKVVLATQFPFLDRGHFYFTKLINEQSELMMACYENPLPDEQLINCDEDLESYRSYCDSIHTYLIAGGHKHPVGRSTTTQMEAFFLRNRSRFHLGKHVQHWSSQDYLSADHVALIGTLSKNDPNLLFASGFQKWGNTTGTIAGKLLCAYLLHEDSQYQEMFDPHRASLIFSTSFIKENWEIIKAFIKSKLTQGVDQLPPKEKGVPIEIDGHMYGVYQDKKGNLHIVDIICPHLGCTCVFNELDKTWDCPCHGSRFDIDGKLIKGPSSSPLNEYGKACNHVDPRIIK